MNLIITADIQLHSYKEFSYINQQGYNNRAWNIMESLDTALSLNQCDLFIVAGDFFHNRAALDIDIIDLAHYWVTKWSQKTHIALLAGNHDQFLLNGNITSLRQFQNIDNCTVIEKPQYIEFEDSKTAIHFSPFHAGSRIIEYGIQDMQIQCDKAGLTYPYLIGHWTAKGAMVGNLIMDGVDTNLDTFQPYTQILLGDIHKSQTIGKNVLYVGSPCQHDFGECNDDKFIWRLDDSSGTPKLSTIDLKLPRFVRVKTLDEAKKYKKKGWFVELQSKSRENSKEAVEQGFRVSNHWSESVVSSNRPTVISLNEAVSQYAKSQNREDLKSVGLQFINDLQVESCIPSHQIKLVKLEAYDFFSYEELIVDFDNKGFVIINGVVVGGIDVDSNGAGKTTVFEAILYALFGYTLRFKISKDSTIRSGTTKNKVILQFSIQDQTYTVIRSRPDGLKLLRGSDDDLTRGTSKDTQSLIESLIGPMDFFLRIAFLAMHYHPSFLSMTDVDKKSFLDQFLGLDVLDHAQDNVNRLLKEESTLIQSLTTQQSICDGSISATQSQIDEYNSEIQSFAEKENQKQQVRLEKINQLKNQLKGIVLDEVPKVDTTKQNQLISSKSNLLNKIKVIENESAQITYPIKSQIQTLTKAASSQFTKGYTCTYCGYVFTGEEDSSKQADHAKKTISLLESQLQQENQKLAESLKSLKSEESEINQLLSIENSRIESIQNSCKSIEIGNVIKKCNIDNLKKSIEDLEKEKPDTPQSLVDSVVSLESKLVKLKSSLSTLQSQIQQHRTTQCNLEFWKVGFSSKGCKSLMYSSLLDLLNQYIQETCNQLSGGSLIVKILPIKESENSNQEKITVDVVNMIGSCNLAGDSIGERARIDIAVNLALRKTLIEMSGYSVNLLFIDEPWLGLDISGKSAVYRLLSEESKNVSNLFVTDQDFSSKGSVDCVVWTATKNITPEGGTSKLVV